MTLNQLIEKYFSGNYIPIIATFDAENINEVCNGMITDFLRHSEIELSVLQVFNYCIYEVMDNVLTHSGKASGVLIYCFNDELQHIEVLVADDGMGIHASLRQNAIYEDFSEEEALKNIIVDKVTDGKGMGYGLYSTKNMIASIGGILEIASGDSIMRFDGQSVTVTKASRTNGTMVYVSLDTTKEIDPKEVMENRTDCETSFNELFLDEDNDNIDNLW